MYHVRLRRTSATCLSQFAGDVSGVGFCRVSFHVSLQYGLVFALVVGSEAVAFEVIVHHYHRLAVDVDEEGTAAVSLGFVWDILLLDDGESGVDADAV